MIRRGILTLALTLGLSLSVTAQETGDTLVIEVEGQASGTIEIELLPDVAPLHVERIKELARTGAYDGVAFHRVIEGFMAQTGDVAYGTRDALEEGRAGTGGSSLPDLPAEFSDVSFETGVVGMARSQDPDSGNSQFFIMLAPATHLDGQYTAVGRVISGQDVVDAIARGDGPNGVVEDPDYMARVTLRGEG